MSRPKGSAGARFMESLKFWSVVVALCAIVGAGMYVFGRDYVGKHLQEMDVEQRAPEIKPQSASPVLAGDEGDGKPPVEAIVTVTEREPTAREERKARDELESPQAGAQVHAAEVADDSDRGDDSGDRGGGEEEAGSSGGSDGYVVAAGAFADEENAERQVRRLSDQGYQPYITTQERDGITYQRVNVGSYDSRAEADRAREKLSSQGYDAAVWGEG